jgi:hypothetical protein
MDITLPLDQMTTAEKLRALESLVRGSFQGLNVTVPWAYLGQRAIDN